MSSKSLDQIIKDSKNIGSTGSIIISAVTIPVILKSCNIISSKLAPILLKLDTLELCTVGIGSSFIAAYIISSLLSNCKK